MNYLLVSFFVSIILNSVTVGKEILVQHIEVSTLLLTDDYMQLRRTLDNLSSNCIDTSTLSFVTNFILHESLYCKEVPEYVISTVFSAK